MLQKEENRLARAIVLYSVVTRPPAVFLTRNPDPVPFGDTARFSNYLRESRNQNANQENPTRAPKTADAEVANSRPRPNLFLYRIYS